MYEKLKHLCQENNVSISNLCMEVTGSTGNLATWKKDYMRSDYLQKVAQNLGVSTDYLLGLTDDKNGQNNSIQTGDIAIKNNSSDVDVSISTSQSETKKSGNYASYDKTTIQVADIFQSLDILDKTKVLNLLVELKGKERT